MGIFKRKRSWANLDAFEGRETSSGVTLTEKNVLGIPAVFACVRVLAESVAALPLMVYQRLPNGNRERADDFSLFHLLHRKPNPRMTSFELRETIMGHLCLRGNSYTYVQRDMGEVVGLWPLHPDRMTIDTKNGNFAYKYQSDGEELTYNPEQILHIRGLGSDGLMGHSPLQLFRDTFGFAKSTADYSAAFFKNGAAPGGILKHPGKLSQEAHDGLKAAWSKGFQGSGKAWKTAILEGGLTWEAIGLKPEDSQMIDSLKFSVVEIARIFRVPMNLLQDIDRATYASIVEMNKAFLVYSLRPWLSRIEQAMESALLTESEYRQYFIEHTTADLLRANHKERYESYQIALGSGFLSVNEVRRLENLNDIGPEGNEYALPMPEERAIQKKKPVSIEERDAVSAKHLPLLRAEIAKFVRLEVEAIREMLSQRSSFDDAWSLYFDKLPDQIREMLGPTIENYVREMANLLKIDFKAPESDVEAFLEKAVSDYALGHTYATRGQLESLFQSESIEGVEKRLDEWITNDKRADKESFDQKVKLANGVFAAMAFGAGKKIVSRTRGKSCALCNTLDGKVIGRTEVMLPAGEWTAENGKKMQVRRNKIGPSYHQGCDCYLDYV